MRIGVLDSGSGGLSVLKQLTRELPNHEYIYFGDNARLPYGDKSKRTIVRYATEIAKFLLAQGVDLLVIACNTIDANARTHIERLCPVPVIGVIQPTIDHIAASGYTHVAVAATTATIMSGIYQGKLARYGIYATPIACPDIVPLIETRNLGADLDAAIHKYFHILLNPNPAISTNVEAVVLGCTHYPLVKDRISAYLAAHGLDIPLINPAQHTAAHVAKIVPPNPVGETTLTFHFSKNDPVTNDRVERIFGSQSS